jgi:hypothetical protein
MLLDERGQACPRRIMLVKLLGVAGVLRADSCSALAAVFENLFRVFHVQRIHQNLIDMIH